MEHNIKNIAIIGVGLIGGSIGLRIKAVMPWVRITGIDVQNKWLECAQELGAIDHGLSCVAEGIKDADLVILATPVGVMQSIVKAALPYLKKDCILTDVGSSKEEINQMMEATLPDDMVFIGGHPMAGSEKAGIEAAKENLFEDAMYVLTPGVRTTPAGLTFMIQFVTALGAKPVCLSPQEHDNMVALISHVPHLTAVSLVNTVNFEGNDALLALAAGGFKDTTRIASSQSEMWVDICYSNQAAIVASLDKLIDEIVQLKTLLLEGKRKEFVDKLQNAKQIRDKL